MQDYQKILSNNQIFNTIVTVNDINRAEDICVLRVSILKGRMFQKTPQHLQKVPRIPPSSLLIYRHKN